MHNAHLCGRKLSLNYKHRCGWRSESSRCYLHPSPTKMPQVCRSSNASLPIRHIQSIPHALLRNHIPQWLLRLCTPNMTIVSGKVSLGQSIHELSVHMFIADGASCSFEDFLLGPSSEVSQFHTLVQGFQNQTRNSHRISLTNSSSTSTCTASSRRTTSRAAVSRSD